MWAAILLVDDLVPALQATFFLAPVTLLVGVVGLARAGVLFRLTTYVSGVGFGLGVLVGLVVAAQFLRYGSLAAAPLAAGLVLFPLGITAVVAVFAGELISAYDLRGGQRRGRSPGRSALLLQLDIAFNALVTPLLGHGLSLSGLAWVAFGC